MKKWKGIAYYVLVLLAIATLNRGRVAAAEVPPIDILGPDVERLGWTPGMAPTAIEAEIEDVSERRKGYFEIPGLSPALDRLYDRRAEFYDRTGLRFGTAYTMLFQGLSAGDWDRFGAAGDFDLMTSWRFMGEEGENTGQVFLDFEERFAMTDRAPNELGAGAGTLQPTANTFNDRGPVIRDFFYEQRLVNGQFRFMIGRADSADYFASTWMQSANNSFVNRAFASPSTIAAPGHGPAAGVSWRPADREFYISAGAANAYNRTTTTGFRSLVDEWTFFSFGEVGWTPTSECGEGRYTISGWHVGERDRFGLPSDWGITAVADQELGEMVQVFARYGFSEEASLGVRHYAQGGAGLKLGMARNDLAGLAFGYSIPGNSALRDEKVVESFYRVQLTRFAQVSVGAQAVFDPSNGPGTDVLGAFWGRIRFSF